MFTIVIRTIWWRVRFPIEDRFGYRSLVEHFDKLLGLMLSLGLITFHRFFGRSLLGDRPVEGVENSSYIRWCLDYLVRKP